MKSFKPSLFYRSIQAGLCLFLFSFVVFPSLAAEETGLVPLVLDDPEKEYPLDEVMEVWQAPQGDSSVTAANILAGDEVEFEPFKTSSADFGINVRTTWARFKVRNMDAGNQTWLLEQAYSMNDTIRLYTVAGNKLKELYTTGDTLPFEDRPVDYHNFVFPIQLAVNETKTFYLAIGGESSKQLNLTVFSPVTFAENTSLVKFGLGIYYGIMLVMACYNLLLFFSVKDRSYLYYVIYIVSYIFAQLAFNGMAYQYLWPGWPELHNVSIPFFIGLTLLCMVLFTRKFLQLRTYNIKLHRVADTIMVLCGLAAVYSIFGAYFVSLRAVLILMLCVIAFIMYSGIRRMLEGYRPANYFVIAWAAFMLGGILIATNKLIPQLPSFFLADYGVQIGSAIEVTLLSLALADRINLLNLEVNKAQEKYKHIVEGSDEVILSLDESYNILAVNQAIRHHLLIKPEMVIGTPFIDLIYSDEGNESITRQFVQEKLAEFAEAGDGEHSVFKTLFYSPILSEPKELKVKLQNIQIGEGRTEILATIAGVEEDNLLEYFEYERKKMQIANSILAVDDITSRVTRNLNKFVDGGRVGLIKMALREILINAIEHGNLEISFDEKTEALAGETYFQLLAARQKDPKLTKRKVRIDYLIRDDLAGYRVSDDGPGFDHKVHVNADMDDRNSEFLDHGRGIKLAKDIFSVVHYNGTGNTVTLIYRYPKEGGGNGTG